MTDIGYFYKKGEPDVWIRTAVKLDRTKYNEMVSYYFDDVLAISTAPMKTLEESKQCLS